ncbi:hypothetical protein [Ktedonobacter robiniae]|uniref:Uncharacterized protein n=1 Tax=Ktedonobacter robiniae TaxID=2778365 RepID=A0ABQ3V2T1_9CHLR|nr:hypothetical protein [Ktedonobacter robiniae]GHO59184.1 hypothetical protein KSB_76590 [Ktedonobacter robiniae]
MAHRTREQQRLQADIEALTSELRDLETRRNQLLQDIQLERHHLLRLFAETQTRRYAIVADLRKRYVQLRTDLAFAEERQIQEINQRLRVARSPMRKLLALMDWQYRREFLYRIASLKRELQSPPRTEEQRRLQREMEHAHREWQETEQILRTGGPIATSETKACEQALAARERHHKHIAQVIKDKEEQLARQQETLRALPDPERDFAKHFIAALQHELNQLTPAQLGIGV